MDVHIVHGNQLSPTGEITEEYKRRIKRALNNAKKDDILILSGGVTRAGFKSEAEAGFQYLTQDETADKPTVFSEDLSTSTAENIRFTRALLEGLGIRPRKVFAYHRKSAVLKTKILYWRLWPEEFRVAVIACFDTSGPIYRVLENTAIVFLALFDPYEKSFVWRWFKRHKRNYTG